MSCHLGVKSTEPVSSSSSPHTPASHSTYADGPIRTQHCGSVPRRVPPPSSLIQIRYAMSQNNKPSLRVIYRSLHLDSSMIIIVLWSLGTLLWRQRTGSPEGIRRRSLEKERNTCLHVNLKLLEGKTNRSVKHSAESLDELCLRKGHNVRNNKL